MSREIRDKTRQGSSLSLTSLFLRALYNVGLEHEFLGQAGDLHDCRSTRSERVPEQSFDNWHTAVAEVLSVVNHRPSSSSSKGHGATWRRYLPVASMASIGASYLN